MTSETMHQLALALDATGDVLASITGDQWTLPTPCPEWAVIYLHCHLVNGNDQFASALSSEAPERPVGPEGDLPEAYRRSARDLVDAFGQPGALDRNVDVPFGAVPGLAALHLRITEVLVHG